MTSSAEPVKRLEAADPVAYLRHDTDVDAPPPADVIERILALPPVREGRRPRARRRMAVAVAALAAAAVAATVAVLPTGDKTSLAARAYAWTPPSDRDAVLYTEMTSEIVFTPIAGAAAPPGQRIVVRIWQHGDRMHELEESVEIDSQGRPVPDSAPGRQRESLEHVQNGGVRRTLSDGKVQTTRADDSGWKRRGGTVFADNLRSIVDKFRERYEKAQLHDAGATTFAGRPAHAYVVTRPNGPRETFYVDPATAQPVGAVVTTLTYAPEVDPRTRGIAPPSPSDRPTAQMTNTVVIDRFERLPATPENLAKLDAPAIDAASAR